MESKNGCVQKEGYDEKKLLNVKKENYRLKDLTFLKNQTPQGPFSTQDEIASYIIFSIDEKEKNTRMYV